MGLKTIIAVGAFAAVVTVGSYSYFFNGQIKQLNDHVQKVYAAELSFSLTEGTIEEKKEAFGGLVAAVDAAMKELRDVERFPIRSKRQIDHAREVISSAAEDYIDSAALRFFRAYGEANTALFDYGTAFDEGWTGEEKKETLEILLESIDRAIYAIDDLVEIYGANTVTYEKSNLRVNVGFAKDKLVGIRERAASVKDPGLRLLTDSPQPTYFNVPEAVRTSLKPEYKKPAMNSHGEIANYIDSSGSLHEYSGIEKRVKINKIREAVGEAKFYELFNVKGDYLDMVKRGKVSVGSVLDEHGNPLEDKLRRELGISVTQEDVSAFAYKLGWRPETQAEVIRRSAFFVPVEQPHRVDGKCLSRAVDEYNNSFKLGIGTAPRINNGVLEGFAVWTDTIGGGYPEMNKEILELGKHCEVKTK